MQLNNIVTAQYNSDLTVDFTADAWFNATEAAEHFGKRPVEWLRLDSTQAYIDRLAAVMAADRGVSADQIQLSATVKGGSRDEVGTWLHPKLTVKFARWLDLDFEIWCDMQIDKLLRPVITGCSPDSVQSLIDAALKYERQLQDQQAFEKRIEVISSDLKRGLNQQQWDDLYRYMKDIAKESDDPDKAYNAIQTHFSRKFKAEHIVYNEALKYFAYVRGLYENGYEPVYRKGSVVLDDRMI